MREREGDPTAEIRTVLVDHGVDELVIGPRRGDPDADAQLGSTARALLGDVDMPVVVVPVPEL